MALIYGTNCGFVASTPAADDPADSALEFDDRAIVTKDTSDATATLVTEIGVWIGTATEEADITVGIYAHDPGDDEPGTLVGSATFAKGTTSGWKKVSGLSISISSSTVYWIAAQLDNVNTVTYTDWHIGGSERSGYKLSQTTLTNPWGDSLANWDGRHMGIYAVWSAAPVGNAGIMTTNTGFWGPTF